VKKVGREPQKLETLNLFSMLQPGKEGSLNDPASRQSFLAQVDSGLTNALSSESTLHGIRFKPCSAVLLPISIRFSSSKRKMPASATTNHPMRSSFRTFGL
jgi:hypothetical protein